MGRLYTVTIDERSEEVEVSQEGDEFLVRIGTETHRLSIGSIDQGRLFSVLMDGASYEVHAQPSAGAYDLLVRNELFHAQVHSGGGRTGGPARERRESEGWVLQSPMTGLVADVLVTPGTAVERGDILLILESMKMKNELRAGRKGIVDRVNVAPGQRVERGQELVRVRS
jgi:biotin carboxyl carrier protein